MPPAESTATKLDRIEAKVDALTAALAELRALVSDTQAAVLNVGVEG